MLTVAHVITDLKVGGAQMMLYKLLSRIDRSEFRSAVVAISSGGSLTDSFREVADVATIDYDRRGLPLASLVRLGRTLRRIRPDVVQTWMFHADLLGGVAARLATRAPVLWNIRTSALGDSRRSTRLGLRALAASSRVIPFEIVSCSVRARDVLVHAGYDARRFVIVPNGFDTERFRPRPEARAEVRRELGLGDGVRLIGLIARWHPIKDHAMFIRAAARIAAARADTFFLLCGDEVDDTNPALRALLDRSGFADRFRLLGRRDDTPRLDAALDVACSSSSTVEAFSNAIGEAMACGVPCVVTDVGDSAMIVDDTGPGDDATFADGCLALLANDDDRARRGAKARQRIEENFELARVVRMYEDLYRRVARGER
jgi:glycosyltransferase involved in cell wall biosynthesis